MSVGSFYSAGQITIAGPAAMDDGLVINNNQFICNPVATFNSNVAGTNFNASSNVKAGNSILGLGYLDLYDNNTPSVQFFSTAGTAYQGYIQYTPSISSSNSYINGIDNFILSIGSPQTEVIYFNRNGIVIAGATGNPYNAGLIFPDGTKQTTGYASDERLKKNITPLSNGIEMIKNLNPVNFQWNPESPLANDDPKWSNTAIQVGFLAQEIENIIPTAVIDNGKFYQLDSTQIIPYLVKANQELSAQISALSNAVAILQSKLPTS